MQPSVITCALCGAEVHRHDAILMDGGDTPICPACADTHTFLCDECSERCWNAENRGDGSYNLCEACRDDHYTRCEHCGDLIPDSLARYDERHDTYYCENCYQRFHISEAIHPYHYKPEPLFYGEGPLFLGVELEADDGGKLDENAARLLDVINSNQELAYVKSDGSLDDGLELVSHPCSLEFHLHEFPWAEALSKLRQMGYYSHNAGTCGLHIHVSRDAFGEDTKEQEQNIAKILYIFERFWQELLRFSRRTESQMKQWAARYGYKNTGHEILEHAKRSFSPGRYACVNLTNAETIEFRAFRGTLRYQTFAATLQFVARLCKVALSFTEEQIHTMSWPDLVLHLADADTPELIAYLKERRLYPNEPVLMESEV